MAVEFWQTIMGHRLIEGTAPALVAQLKRLNDNLENLIELQTNGVTFIHLVGCVKKSKECAVNGCQVKT